MSVSCATRIDLTPEANVSFHFQLSLPFFLFESLAPFAGCCLYDTHKSHSRQSQVTYLYFIMKSHGEGVVHVGWHFCDTWSNCDSQCKANASHTPTSGVRVIALAEREEKKIHPTRVYISHCNLLFCLFTGRLQEGQNGEFLHQPLSHWYYYYSLHPSIVSLFLSLHLSPSLSFALFLPFFPSFFAVLFLSVTDSLVLLFSFSPLHRQMAIALLGDPGRHCILILIHILSTTEQLGCLNSRGPAFGRSRWAIQRIKWLTCHLSIARRSVHHTQFSSSYVQP